VCGVFDAAVLFKLFGLAPPDLHLYDDGVRGCTGETLA